MHQESCPSVVPESRSPLFLADLPPMERLDRARIVTDDRDELLHLLSRHGDGITQNNPLHPFVTGWGGQRTVVRNVVDTRR
jgi:hypothetical protein